MERKYAFARGSGKSVAVTIAYINALNIPADMKKKMIQLFLDNLYGGRKDEKHAENSL